MSKKSNQIMKQAGILAAAGIICRIIGFIYRIPLTHVIGDKGNGYYGFPYLIYSIILLITSYSIPSAVSKVMAERLALKEYRNAQRVFHCSLIYVTVVGGLASVLTFVIAPYVVDKETAAVLRVFCPTIFFSGLLGTLRGYFQAHRTMVQSSISQIFEQIMNAIVSIVMAMVFVNIVNPAGLTEQEFLNERALNGAIGSAMGTGAGVLTALLFMVLVYRLNKPSIQRRLQNDRTQVEETYGTIFKVIIAMVTPIILSTFIYNVNSLLNTSIFQKVSTSIGMYTKSEATVLYGIFSGKAVVLINVPIAIASAMAASLLPNVATTYTLYGEEKTAEQVNETLKMLMIIVIPITIGMFVFAGPIMKFMYPAKGQWELGGNLLRVLSFDVIFISISTLSNSVLQALGHPQKTVVNASIALVLQTILLYACLVFTDLGVYSLAVTTVAYAIIMCILNRRAVVKYLSYKQDLLSTYLYPLIAALVMGLVSGGAYVGMYYVFPHNRIVLILAVVLAMGIYAAAIIRFGVVSEEEIYRFPKGATIVSISKKLHLL